MALPEHSDHTPTVQLNSQSAKQILWGEGAQMTKCRANLAWSNQSQLNLCV